MSGGRCEEVDKEMISLALLFITPVTSTPNQIYKDLSRLDRASLISTLQSLVEIV